MCSGKFRHPGDLQRFLAARSSKLKSEINSEKSLPAKGQPKKEDLDKMHVYRDAIRDQDGSSAPNDLTSVQFRPDPLPPLSTKMTQKHAKFSFFERYCGSSRAVSLVTTLAQEKAAI